MSIDIKALKKQLFEPRTKIIPVPRLKDWSKNVEKPTWTIRSLSTKEIWRSEEAASEDNRKTVEKLSDALAGSSSDEAAKQIKALVGVSVDVPRELAKRIYQLTYASVDPVCDLDTARIIETHFPTEFLTITQGIQEISGLGSKKKSGRPLARRKSQASAVPRTCMGDAAF